jgi:hypothetical protein
VPFFSPWGWDPGIGLDAAIELLGWTCVRTSAGSPAEAGELLRQAREGRPLLAGPMEFGLLRHHPESGIALGSDHYVVVIGAEHGLVRFHDPHGHPYATLPAGDFLAAGRADSIGYSTEPFIARAGFHQVHDVGETGALSRALPAAARWLAGDTSRPVPPGSVGGAVAVERLAEMADAGLGPGQRDHLARFAIRVGARRLADAAACLDSLGRGRAAGIAAAERRSAVRLSRGLR